MFDKMNYNVVPTHQKLSASKFKSCSAFSVLAEKALESCPDHKLYKKKSVKHRNTKSNKTYIIPTESV